MAEVRDFLMPDLGEGLTEGEIITWLVAEGDQVSVDQPVAEVSTEKAVVEVPTPFAGRVATLHGSPGDMIQVGKPLISVEVGPAASEGSGNVLVGYGTNDEPPIGRRRAAASNGGAPAVPSNETAARPQASPLVRRLAAERGIDLSAIAGTGPGGIVTRRDLEAALQERDAAATATAVGVEGPVGAAQREPQHRVDSATATKAETAASERRRLIGADRVAAERLARSHREIPAALATTTVDATALLAYRASLEWIEGVHVTPFAVLLRLCVRALQRHSRLNAHFDTESNEIVPFDSVHLGVAVQTDRGLVVPVIREAEKLPTLQLAAELERFAAAARAGTVAAGDLTGSTFTVSNFGAFGVDGGAALINPPEVAILGVGRIAQRPWVVEGRVEARHVVQLSLSFDHRVADGGVAGGFLKHLADLIEQAGAANND